MIYYSAHLGRCIAPLAVAGLLIACATPPKQPKSITQNSSDRQAGSQTPMKDAIVQTGKNAPSSMQAPLKDFNLVRDDIPDILKNIDYPYRIDGPVYCDSLIAEITALNGVLGTSADISNTLSRTENAAQSASNAAQDALEDAATGWIPYRSVLRRLSGATKHERKVRAAYETGRIRRAFLKGVGGAFGCAYPGRPSSLQGPMTHHEAESLRP